MFEAHVSSGAQSAQSHGTTGTRAQFIHASV